MTNWVGGSLPEFVICELPFAICHFRGWAEFAETLPPEVTMVSHLATFVV